MLMLRDIMSNLSSKQMALLSAIFLVVLVFFDVIFLGTTTSMLAQITGMHQNVELIKFFPDAVHRVWNHNINDAGGSICQSEPMIRFIKNAIYNLQSIYWNPYSGAGSLGPETLVDQKFSFLSLLTALFGGSILAFDMVTLAINGIALYFFYLLLREFFKLSSLSCFVACILYLLNGYNISNLSSNVTHCYLYFPILLFTLCSFIKSPTALRFVFVVLGNVLLLTNTFQPTSFMVYLTLYSIALAFILSLYSHHIKSMGLILATLLGACLVAFLGTSLLYFPVFESLSFLKTFEMYNERIFYSANLSGLLSFFSPRHFFDSYSATDPHIYNWYKMGDAGGFQGSTFNPNLLGNSIFHFGIIASVLASFVTLRLKHLSPLVVGTIVGILFVSLGRVFRIPIIYQAVDLIYGLKSIGEQYWWVTIAIVLPIIVGFGMEALRNKQKRWWSLVAIYAIIISSIVYLYQEFGFIEPYYNYRVKSVLILCGIVVLSFMLIVLMKQSTSKKTVNILTYFIVALMFLELYNYSHHIRYLRNDIFTNPTKEISFLKESAGTHRISTLGWNGLPAELGSAFQVQQIESMNMNIIPSYLNFFHNNFVLDFSQKWGIFTTFHNVKDIPILNLSILNFLSVKYIVLPINFINYQQYLIGHGYKEVLKTNKTLILENLKVFPRIFAASHIAENDGTPDQEGLSLRDVVFTKDETLLSQAQKLGITQHNLDNPRHIKDEAIQLLEYENAYVKAKALLNEPAIVVLPDNWHPNWSAWVDGEQSYIGIINESFRGMVLDKGEHVIEMRYRPKTLTLAQYTTLSMVVLLMSIILFRRRIDNWFKRKLKTVDG